MSIRLYTIIFAYSIVYVHTHIHLVNSSAVRNSRRTRDVDVAVVQHLRVLGQLLSPLTHVLQESLLVVFLTEIDRILVLANLSDLRAGRNVGEAKVVLVQSHLDRALDLAVEDVLAQVKLLADGSGETYTIDCVESLDHGADSLEATREVGLGVLERRSDEVGKLQKECLPLLRALALVSKSERLVGTSAQLDKVEFVRLKHLTQFLGLLWVEPLVLELDTVELDSNDKVGLDPLADFLCDFESEACAVLKTATIFVGAVVSGRRKELGEEVTVSTVELDTVVSGLLEVLRCVGKAINDTMNLLLGRGVWLVERHAHDVSLELNVAGGYRLWLDPALALTTGMADLTDHQAAVLLALCSHISEPFEPLTAKVGFARNDRVAHSLELVVFDHDVARQDQAESTLSPSLVDIDQILRRNTASGEVLRVPGGYTLRHCAFEESVWGRLAAELELQRLAQRGRAHVLGLVSR